jgi:Mlc titration factor MtfA (ptsG expression regulator)
MAFITVLGLVLLVAAWLAGQPLLAARRRRRIAARPFASSWRQIIDRNVPIYRRLPDDLRIRLRRLIRVFIADKQFVGCAGMQIDDEVRVTIAAQACLLLLHRDPVKRALFPSLSTILVYPGPFVAERVRAEPSGVVQETRDALTGESHARGQVVLSWEDVLAGAADPSDGRNVVIHEFAHQLDQEKGYANGAPPLGRRERYERWSRVLGEAFAQLRERAAMGEPTLLNPYGATDPAEFFAVASEHFFEQPHRMAAELPALYVELRDFYGVEPTVW